MVLYPRFPNIKTTPRGFRTHTSRDLIQTAVRINNTFTLDCTMITLAKITMKVRDPVIVSEGQAQKGHDLPRDWSRKPEVLVHRAHTHQWQDKLGTRVPRVPHRLLISKRTLGKTILQNPALARHKSDSGPPMNGSPKKTVTLTAENELLLEAKAGTCRACNPSQPRVSIGFVRVEIGLWLAEHELFVVSTICLSYMCPKPEPNGTKGEAYRTAYRDLWPCMMSKPYPRCHHGYCPWNDDERSYNPC